MDELNEVYLSKKEVCRIIRRSAATLDRWEKAGTFPKRRIPPHAKPVRDSKTGRVIRSHNCRVIYLKSEIDAWKKILGLQENEWVFSATSERW